MKKDRSFDCVEMKQALQTQRAKEYAGLADEEIAQRIQKELATSRHPLAVWYRRIAAHKTATAKH